MLTKLTAVNIIIMLYTLNLYSDVCQLYLSKTGCGGSLAVDTRVSTGDAVVTQNCRGPYPHGTRADRGSETQVCQ